MYVCMHVLLEIYSTDDTLNSDIARRALLKCTSAIVE